MSEHKIHMRHAHHHLERKGWDDVKSFWNNVFSPEEETRAFTTRVAQTVTDEDFWATATAQETIATKGAPLTATAANPTTTAHTSAHSTAPASTTLRALTTKAAVSSSPSEVLPSDVLTGEISATGTLDLESTLAVASPTSKTFEAATSATAAPSATAVSSNQQGTSGAAKAGIAIGVLAGLLVVFLLVWFLFNKRKRQMEAEKQRLADDEKINGPFSDKNEIKTPTSTAAPRLSLRPVTQFMPNGVPERRASRANMLNTNSNPPVSPLNRPAGASAWERPTVASTETTGERPGTSASANPFGDNQRIPEESSPVSPSGDSPVSPDAVAAGAVAGAAAGAAAGTAAGGLERKASIRKDGLKPLDLTKPPALPLNAHPPSPAGTDYSMNTVAPGQSPGPSASAAAIAAAGGPAQSTVHRVQLDFKPTLEDEMGLQAGQLVRLLHEYDDGWALCIRLDRSQQGVVPRTCLSARPVKPRPPQGGPPGPRGPPVRPNYGPGGPGPMNPNYGPMGGPGYGPGPNYGPNGGPRGPGGPPRGPPYGGPGPHGGRPGPGPINTKFMQPRGPPPPGGSYSRPQSPAGPMMPRNGPGPGPMSPNNGPMSPNGGHPVGSPVGNPNPMSPVQMPSGPSSPVDRAITHGSQSPVTASRRLTPPSHSPITQEYRPESRTATASPAPPPPVNNETAPGQAY
ncbi:hypothetical protein B0T20DRAFT_408235 [Sordaria brevicollis]|uniref:SH3 domain-containing protein n=1 Tax=Sordaria brevicollis TaxID=83679 RepID=A0AAE0PI73_SORBR|nr:hypothetical protein B0T20DRAFT_408235 [Sordaria brevicollis]